MSLIGFGAPPPPPAGPPGKATDVQLVSEREFEAAVLQSEVPVLIELSSTRSAACRQIAPEVEAFAREMKGKLKVVNVDVDQSPNIAQQLRVQSVPMFLVFAEGRIADAQVGPLTRKALHAMVEPHLPRAEGALKPRELQELLKVEKVMPIDTRDKGAFDRAHLPGAKHFPLEEIENRIAELLMLGSLPVLYCRSGDKSKELAERLTAQEVPVAFLEGGLLGWESEGLPVEKP